MLRAYRTALCKSKREGFKDTYPDDLLAPVLRALIERTNLNPSEVGDVVGTAVADVAAAIKAGFYDIGIGAGLESMTANPMAWEGSVNPRVLVRSSYIYIRSRQWHNTKIAYSQRVLLP
ncbi:3-ketoacyl-CoA thiolase 2, peroxisomal-like isoform X2 [Camellia sinensis]|uniref:3-ketoacyl-CoA thiolase 2, peroxisomal-like isoform X2 n=1 Tax=Camellia sinensis TaxID=4442 RepID=UPI0010366C36|nr:3-ketoacyl-CoA thiolase 2, peroxisomal-like isoform X2 [Camellia sinensis]XP_028120596.1 3-ketoacyl-CoA thiolase 2, peroxisomal-like isoform X2 [Camellia sinensis]